MTSILANSPEALNQVKGLLDKKIPSYRQAYSDRTAWIMACLSELAYIKFNPSILDDKRKIFLQENILKSLNKKKKTDLLKWMDSLEYNYIEERKKLERELKTLRMEIIETFDHNGTQAILISYDESVVLAFRGTESTSLKDIKADLDARTTQYETGGKVHRGFKKAFEEIYLDICEELNKDTLKDKPLFITGHSLGGALATVATKKLSHKGGIAACYTFGSPRVGDEEWIAGIKTPIYRLVNAADGVTMLPPVWIILGFAWILRCIAWCSLPLISRLVESLGQRLLSSFGGYLHGGNMRYLTNCPISGQYDNVRLLYSIGFLGRMNRMKGWGISCVGKLLSDHSITIYRKKLMVIAEKRNPNSDTN